MNEDRITVTGVVGSDPRPFLSGKGLPITTFRLASAPRVFDRERGEWRDGETNWYTVSAFRRLADNTAFSLRKGEHVVVTGKLRLRAWQTAEKSGTSAEIDADAIGHDLSWAVTRAQRFQPRDAADASAPAAATDGAAAEMPDASSTESAVRIDGVEAALGFGSGGDDDPFAFAADDLEAALRPGFDPEPEDESVEVEAEAEVEGGEAESGEAADQAARGGMFSFGRR